MKIKLNSKNKHEKGKIKIFKTGRINFIKECPSSCSCCPLNGPSQDCWYLFKSGTRKLNAEQILKTVRF